MTRFKCLRCSHCCFFTGEHDYPVVLEGEVRVLEEEAKRRGVSLSFIKIANGFYLWAIEGFCPFYDFASSSCTIHEKKPLSCRMFPLLLNIAMGTLNVSMMCDWVYINREKVFKGDVRETFPDEVGAVSELLSRLLGSRVTMKPANNKNEEGGDEKQNPVNKARDQEGKQQN